jgi:signal transduction histidine kinase
MRRTLLRLRWQLTLSHLIAIAFTLLSMIAAVMLVASSWISAQGVGARQPGQDARLVAQAIGGVVERGEPAEMNILLRSLADGSLRVVLPFGPPDGHRMDGFDPSLRLHDVSFVVLVGLDGRVLASSHPAGASFIPPEWDAVQRLAADSLAGRHSDGGLVTRPLAASQGALGAYPVLDASGRPVATVVLATSAVPQGGGALDVWRTLLVFAAASIAVLGGAFLFAVASSSVVGYLLSRRLVARLEQLGKAAESLRSGDLAARVPVAGADEITQLQLTFNAMAADLELALRDLRAERDRVSSLLDARRQLIANVSHELRTPVATIRGYLESGLSRDGAVPADLRSDLETMQRELVRLHGLIEDLFALSRAEVGRLDLRLEPTDVGAVVQQLVAAQAPLAWQQRRVQVLAEVDGEPSLALVDTQRLEQIVSNLIGNAVRHTPPGGLVAVAVASHAGQVEVEVRDTGDGIPPDEMPRIFERFYRGRSEDVDGRAGAGLGLALVKELAEAMGGTVEADSLPGEGSRFTVHLPRSPVGAVD